MHSGINLDGPSGAADGDRVHSCNVISVEDYLPHSALSKRMTPTNPVPKQLAYHSTQRQERGTEVGSSAVRSRSSTSGRPVPSTAPRSTSAERYRPITTAKAEARQALTEGWRAAYASPTRVRVPHALSNPPVPSPTRNRIVVRPTTPPSTRASAISPSTTRTLASPMPPSVLTPASQSIESPRPKPESMQHPSVIAKSATNEDPASRIIRGSVLRSNSASSDSVSKKPIRQGSLTATSTGNSAQSPARLRARAPSTGSTTVSTVIHRAPPPDNATPDMRRSPTVNRHSLVKPIAGYKPPTKSEPPPSSNIPIGASIAPRASIPKSADRTRPRRSRSSGTSGGRASKPDDSTETSQETTTEASTPETNIDTRITSSLAPTPPSQLPGYRHTTTAGHTSPVRTPTSPIANYNTPSYPPTSSGPPPPPPSPTPTPNQHIDHSDPFMPPPPATPNSNRSQNGEPWTRPPSPGHNRMGNDALRKNNTPFPDNRDIATSSETIPLPSPTSKDIRAFNSDEVNSNFYNNTHSSTPDKNKPKPSTPSGYSDRVVLEASNSSSYASIRDISSPSSKKAESVASSPGWRVDGSSIAPSSPSFHWTDVHSSMPPSPHTPSMFHANLSHNEMSDGGAKSPRDTNSNSSSPGTSRLSSKTDGSGRGSPTPSGRSDSGTASTGIRPVRRPEPKRGDPNAVQIGEVFNMRYEVIRKLGAGDWSTVWLAFDRIREAFVALKISKETRSKAMHEINIYTMVNETLDPEAWDLPGGFHHSLIRMLDYFEAKVAGGINTIMAFEVLGRDLLSLITYPNGALTYKGVPLHQVKVLAKYSLQGLAYLHDVVNVFHCDLKPENILLNTPPIEQLGSLPEVGHLGLRGDLTKYFRASASNQEGVKIIDMGASRAVGDTVFSVDMIQTLEYRSPEVVLGFHQVGTPIDIWSLACIIWEMITGVYLFNPGEDRPRNAHHVALFISRLGDLPKTMAKADGKHVSYFFDSAGKFRHQKVQYIGFSDLTTRYGYCQQEADEVVEFLMPMLRFNPKERVTAREHLQHRWLQS